MKDVGEINIPGYSETSKRLIHAGQKVTNTLTTKYPGIEKVILYGSAARNQARDSGSDADICIVYHPQTVEEGRAGLGILEELKSIEEEGVLHFLFRTAEQLQTENKLIWVNIQREGVLLYQRKK